MITDRIRRKEVLLSINHKKLQISRKEMEPSSHSTMQNESSILWKDTEKFCSDVCSNGLAWC